MQRTFLLSALYFFFLSTECHKKTTFSENIPYSYPGTFQSELRDTVKIPCCHVVPKRAFYYSLYQKYIKCTIDALFWYLFSTICRKKNITMHKLCDIYLYHPRCLFVYLSLELHNSKVIEKFIVFINIQKFLSVWSLAVLLGLSSPLYFIFFYHIGGFRNVSMPDYTYHPTALRLFPKISSSRVRKYCFEFPKD